jgi:hypothetical protein
VLFGCCTVFLHIISQTAWHSEKVTKCVFWVSVQILSATFLIVRRIQRYAFINVDRSSCKVPLLFSEFSETGILSTDF